MQATTQIGITELYEYMVEASAKCGITLNFKYWLGNWVSYTKSDNRIDIRSKDGLILTLFRSPRGHWCARVEDPRETLDCS